MNRTLSALNGVPNTKWEHFAAMTVAEVIETSLRNAGDIPGDLEGALAAVEALQENVGTRDRRLFLAELSLPVIAGIASVTDAAFKTLQTLLDVAFTDKVLSTETLKQWLTLIIATA